MEEQLSDVLDNLLGLLLLEGSYEIEETEEAFMVSIETKDAGRLIGFRGESLEGLQLIVNQMISQKIKEGGSEPNRIGGFKRVVLDVEGWRKQKEEELVKRADGWGKQVKESNQEMELEPMSAWQRRIVHMTISEMDGIESESIGDGRDRHVVIKLKTPAEGEARQGRQISKVKTGDKEVKSQKSKVKKGKDQNTDAETEES